MEEGLELDEEIWEDMKVSSTVFVRAPGRFLLLTFDGRKGCCDVV